MLSYSVIFFIRSVCCTHWQTVLLSHGFLICKKVDPVLRSASVWCPVKPVFIFDIYPVIFTYVEAEDYN